MGCFNLAPVQTAVVLSILKKNRDWLTTRRTRTRLLLVFLAGLISAAALPPVSIPAALFAGFTIFIICLRQETRFWQGFRAAFCFALGYHLAGLYWISASLFVDIHRYIAVLPFSLLALPSYLALLFGLCAAPAVLLRRTPLAQALFLTGALFISEALRGVIMNGFPWNLFGNIWSDTPNLLQAASLMGAYGLTLLTLLAAIALGSFCAGGEKRLLALLGVSAALLSALALWGELRLNNTQTSFNDAVHVRLVQASVMQSERRTPEDRMATFSRMIALSEQAPAPGDAPPTHIFWPETASPFFIATMDDARALVRPVVPNGGALMLGAPGLEEDASGTRYYNTLVVIDDKNAVAGIYAKARLVPFGEFIPLRNILKMMPVASDVIGASDFSAGPGPRSLRAPGLPAFSPMICYEAIFSGAVVDRADPPALLLQITNDAWFGTTSGPYQHYAMARIRAVEEGLPLLRSANSGISAIVDALGRPLQMLGLNQRGVVDGRLPRPLEGPTLFSQLGNLPSHIAGLVLLLTGLFCGLFKRPRHRS